MAQITRSNALLIGNPDAVINSTMPLDASNSWFVFSIVRTTDATVTATTLNTNTVEGSKTIISVGPVAVGKSFELFGATGIQQFTVTATSGAGPYTLTVDIPVAFTFTSGDSIVGRVVPTNIRIDGRGMRITGTGSRAYQFTGARSCEVSGLIIDGSFDWGAGSFDLGGRDNHSHHNICYGHAGSAGGFAIEGNVNSSIDHCHTHNTGTNGFYLSTARLSSVTDCTADGCDIGVRVDNFDGPSKSCRVENVTVNNPTTYGMLIADVSSDVVFQGCRVLGAGSHGYDVANASIGLKFIGCHAERCTGSGFYLQSATDVEVTNCSSVDNKLSGFKLGAHALALTNCYAARNGVNDAGGVDSNVSISSCVDCMITGLHTEDTLSSCDIIVTGGSTVKFFGLSQRQTLAGTWYGIYIDTGTPSVDIVGATIVCFGTGTNEWIHSTGACDVAASHFSVSGCTRGVSLVSPGTFRRGPAGRVLNLQGGGLLFWPTANTLSFGTLVANGVTGVAVAFANIIAQDRIRFTLNTIGGTVGHPKYTIVAGTGFTFTSDAADTSTWEWWIE